MQCWIALWVRVGLLLLSAACALSCYGSPADSPGSSPAGPVNATATTTKRPRNHTIDVETVLGGWPATPNITQSWAAYANEYKAKMAEMQAADQNMMANLTSEQKAALQKERENWPSNWKDLGPGYPGDPPPPWAYAPKDTGLPDFCYQWPMTGTCTQNLVRYGYNAYANKCDAFPYSGCGGNQNNFKDLLSCEKACMVPPVSGCDTESQILAPNDYETDYLQP